VIEMKVFVLDLNYCNGCYNCQIACKDEHVGNDWAPYALSQPDTGSFWLKVNQKDRGTIPKVKVAYIPSMCYHCDNAPCMKAATNGAIYKREDGIVIIDPVKSVGQKQLVAACPYGAIYYNEVLNIPQKCTACAHLLDAASTTTDPGLQVPRCVDACPTEALKFGDDTDPAFQAMMAQGEVLNPEYGTKPRAYYLNLPKMFLAGALADPVADECVEGATVTATDLTSGAVYSTSSDNYGDFWLEGLTPNRSYELNITASGYLSKKQVVFLGTDTNVGDIELFAGAV
jgi:tetrathionate reductase subunit B